MHSVALDSNGSPKKRALSRGMSEDESLRSIIKETENSSRRLTRSDSRTDSLKRRSDSQQSDQDLLVGLPDVLELQANYDEVVQELRGVEIEREALLFQVDVLQDTLVGVEELLAEAQREAGRASLELEQEREAKKKLENVVYSLMQEVERLKEERNTSPSAAVNTLSTENGSEVQDMRQHHRLKNSSKELTKVSHKQEKDSSLCEACSSRICETSEDIPPDEESILMKLQKMISKPMAHIPSLSLDEPDHQDGVLRRPYDEDGRDQSPDRNDSDSISTYEDASADTPEQQRLFPGAAEALELSDDSATSEGNRAENSQASEGEPRNPDACIVS
ncbi:uncharacterized protein si:ch1073-456m8.1 [Thalassophryne amazonica]|uniref:uncharacterized protein si:ch1073-456m8.1 n=1 Tax=Thalassophryne amazonica TaxID=390379 RepID=UPI0014714007|nr:uncharacterized protein si:ch1073-456m8.1 [Thalassophryne amazonica]